MILRRAALAAADGATDRDAEAPIDATKLVATESQTAEPAQAGGTRRRRAVSRRRVALCALVVAVLLSGAAYSQRHTFTAQGADLSRRVIGDENTARVESWYFRADDRMTKLKYRFFGGETNPFADTSVKVDFVAKPESRAIPYYLSTDGKPPPRARLTADTLGPAPLQLPKTSVLRDNPEAGEGQWSTVGLPRSSPNDILMARTFVRPDKSRPYAMVGVLLMDSRRVRLHMTGGTVDPGGDRGVKGPGTIPSDHVGKLVAALNGGFKGPHGGFGMFADGKEYRPLRNGLASLAVMKDGTLRMGEWGKDLTWDENIAAVRQNAVLLVDNGQVSPRTAEGNDTWGYVQVNSAEFITWRSAVGLTKDGNLIFAAGNSLSAETLAKALWAAGAHTAMQLDINNPYVLIGTFFQQADGSVKAERFMDNMPDTPSRFLKPQERDFLWVTLDESKYF